MTDGAVLLLSVVVGLQLLSVVLFYAAHRQRIVEREELTSVIEEMSASLTNDMEELKNVVEEVSASLTSQIEFNAKLIDDLGALTLPRAAFYDIDQEILEMKDRVSEIEAQLDRIESAVDSSLG